MSISLNMDPSLVVGKLVKFWGWADAQCAFGNAPNVTGSWIDVRVGVAGFANAMQKEGWLTITNAGIEIPNYDRHMGQGAKARALTAKRVAKTREQKSNGHVTLAPLPDKIRGDKNISESKGEGEKPRLHPADVAAVYDAYPRKIGKGEAYRAIEKALVRLVKDGNRDPDPVSWLLARVQTFAHSPAGNAGSYTPHPATWFNADRFDDDPKEWERQKSNSHHAPPGPRINPLTGKPIIEKESP